MKKESNTSQVPITKLIVQLHELLIQLNYAKDTIRHHRNVWSKLEKYCLEKDIKYFSIDVGLSFLKDYYQIEKYDITLSSHRSYIRRSILMLSDFYLSGSIFKNHPYKQHEYPTEFSDVMNLFITKCVERYLATRSVRQFRLTLEKLSTFLVNNKITSLNDITPQNIETFVKTYAEYARATISHAMYMLRKFLEFAFENNYTSLNLSLFVPKIKVPVKSKIPAIYTEDEINRILAVIEYSNPLGKRDHAMILLAVRYGMRSCDIKNLKLSNLNWENNTLQFIQSKTGVEISYTILKDVGWALIEYLKNGRPHTTSDNIFVCHSAPYAPFAEGHALASVVSKYFRQAKISHRDDQVKGFHALRHSLASTLLENDTPIHDIANILGHESIASTIVYTKINIKQLLSCALEVIDDE